MNKKVYIYKGESGVASIISDESGLYAERVKCTPIKKTLLFTIDLDKDDRQSNKQLGQTSNLGKASNYKKKRAIGNNKHKRYKGSL